MKKFKKIIRAVLVLAVLAGVPEQAARVKSRQQATAAVRIFFFMILLLFFDCFVGLTAGALLERSFLLWIA